MTPRISVVIFHSCSIFATGSYQDDALRAFWFASADAVSGTWQIWAPDAPLKVRPAILEAIRATLPHSAHQLVAMNQDARAEAPDV